MSEDLGKAMDPKNEEAGPARAVAFPNEAEITEEKLGGGAKPKGIEMKRELTREDKELAAAGYEHLEEKKGQKPELQQVDITEHRLILADLHKTLETSFDAKVPEQSRGLTSEEAAARLERDGRNVLTPPKKKSALRKVRFWRSSGTCFPHLAHRRLVVF